MKTQKEPSRPKKTPTREITRSRKAAPAEPSPGKGGAGPLILVVDDYQDAREMCAEYLVFSGFRTIEAKDGHEAIKQTQEGHPDLILMDLSLPGLDGWEATRRLKKDPKTRDIPVIALTGHALAGHSEGAKEAGCDSFLTKPCLPDAMVAEVKRVLALGKPTRRKPDHG